MKFVLLLSTALLFAFVAAAPAGVDAATTWASKPSIRPLGDRCVRIATGGNDHGEANAQKFADELLAGDIETFRKEKGLATVTISNRLRKCRYNLWFFGDEYDCSSVATVCW